LIEGGREQLGQGADRLPGTDHVPEEARSGRTRAVGDGLEVVEDFPAAPILNPCPREESLRLLPGRVGIGRTLIEARPIVPSEVENGLRQLGQLAVGDSKLLHGVPQSILRDTQVRQNDLARQS
jgi:hypothetical protein